METPTRASQESGIACLNHSRNGDESELITLITQTAEASRWSPAWWASARKTLLTLVVVPLLFYFVSFSILTYPLITHISTDCYCDQGDGYQEVWNLWWIDYSVTVLHRSPLDTNYLYFPASLNLIVHDLDTLNDFFGIALHWFVALPQVYNLLLIAGFLLTGLATFGLVYYLTSHYLASLLAGFAFTFSNFHFANAWMSHLPFVSIYWIPLFLLCWYRLLEKP